MIKVPGPKPPLLSAVCWPTVIYLLEDPRVSLERRWAEFEPLHELFQEQYTELAKAIDEIVERIRALDVKAPASFSEFKSLSSIAEETGAPAAGVR